MGKKREKYGVLNRTDHRLDMSPVGRNLFVSRDKQMQHREARRLRLWMRVVLTLALTAAGLAAAAVAVFYLGPWFQSELTLNTGSAVGTSSLPSSVPSDAIPEYDDLGLPVYGEDVCLFVVNHNSPADREFLPELAEAEGVQVDSRVAPALRMLAASAKEAGLSLVFTEGYVSYDEQERRFEAKVDELKASQGLTTVMARAKAASLEPQPGESDFQSGMCVRLDGDPKSFGESRTCSWLKANMGKYGFVFRYPEYKDDDTGVVSDLTVIRYVGSQCASAMQQRTMCLEEYINYLESQ